MDALSPHFWVKDMHASIAFYRDVLGFEVRRAEPAESPTFAALTRGRMQQHADQAMPEPVFTRQIVSPAKGRVGEPAQVKAEQRRARR